MRASLPIVALLLFACGEPPTLDPLDQDHDGWITPYDCDDLDPLVHPAAAEVCDGRDNDCNGDTDEPGALDAALWYEDADGDGFGNDLAVWWTCDAPANTVSVAGDCDDWDAEVGPEADELCDGIDNDCDDLTDEADAVDTTRFHLDADGDGYGTEGVYQDGCSPPSGYVDDDTDCNDGDADVHPGAVEVCDPADVDEDCNGLADDEDEAAEGLATWTVDNDGDGYGVSGDEVLSCQAQDGRAERDGDCDDSSDGVHPDAAELCGDGADNDCDGLTDGDDPDALGEVDLYNDADGDGFGDPAAWAGTGCDLSEGVSADATDCDDNDAAVYPGATEIWYDGIDQDCGGDDDDDADGDGVSAQEAGGEDCDDSDPAVLPGALEQCDNGVDDDCDGRIDPCAAWTWSGEPGARSGGAVSGAGDIDGDGVADLIIGAELAGDASQGAAWLWLGPLSGDPVALTGDTDAGHAGAAVAGVGDLDGDGYGELLVSAPQQDLGGGSGSGGAWLLSGPLTGGVLADLAAAVLVGEDGSDEAGVALAGVGDVDGDGVPDMVIGASEADPSGSRTGATYLLLGPVSGTVDLWFADGVWRGEAAGDQAGAALAGVGDVDGDGLADVLVGAPNRRGDDDWAGAAYLVSGPGDAAMDLADASARLLGVRGSDQAGAAVASAGDVDGDGLGDLLVGAPRQDGGGSDSGAAYLLLGAVSGDVALSSANLVMVGSTAEDLAGSAVAGGFDLDGDGAGDIAIGARSDDSGGTDAGAVYLLSGPGSGTLDLADAHFRLTGDLADLALGSVLAAPGDVTGDGLDELILGVPLSGDDDGAVWVIEGW